MELTGEPWDMTAVQQLTVYRLAQESLTNAFKHGDRSRGTHLHLAWAATSVELRIRSSLITRQAVEPKTTPSGRGIAGMKARAAAAGGWVETVRGAETFDVLAFLPSAVPDQHAAAARNEPRLLALEGAQP
jgi:signal transduction histidine kinase